MRNLITQKRISLAKKDAAAKSPKGKGAGEPTGKGKQKRKKPK